jgi:hypothetical protein
MPAVVTLGIVGTAIARLGKLNNVLIGFAMVVPVVRRYGRAGPKRDPECGGQESGKSLDRSRC